MVKSRWPVISVAIATRNYGRYLPRALDSVFRCHNPTGAPLQVVVADDASTDTTSAVLAEYRLRYPDQLQVVSIRTPGGLGAAKNAALEQCVGRTVAILDADDEFLPEKLIHCHAALHRSGIDIVTNDFYHQREEGERVLRSRATGNNWYWPPSTWVFRNGLVRFNPHGLGGEDPEWMERNWLKLRHRHLDLPLNVQHLHGRNSHLRPEIAVPGHQAAGRLVGCPHPADRLAPVGWACRLCGNQYLVPVRCCEHAAVARPLLFYWTALSPAAYPGDGVQDHRGDGFHGGPSVEFSLVILTRNRLKLTQRAVSSILERIPSQRRREMELVFVDGYSTDGTLDYLRELAETHPVKLILTHPAETFNYARACNRGARAAVGRYLLLLNNDIELRGDAPWGPLRAALEDPRVAVVGASTVWSTTQRNPEWESDASVYRLVKRPVTGDFWGVRREVYWELGGVDEAFEGYGYDELDFQYRAQLAHYHLALARVGVYHQWHGTFGPTYGSAVMKKMGDENRHRFERKHGQGIYVDGPRVEPFASHSPPTLSLVVVAGDEESRLRGTLQQALHDPACRSGAVQIVVVENGGSEGTALLLQEYRLRLPLCLTVVRLSTPVGLAQARQIGQARAIGTIVRHLAAGDWAAIGDQENGSTEALSPPQASGDRSRAGSPRPDAAGANAGTRSPRDAPRLEWNRDGHGTNGRSSIHTPRPAPTRSKA